VGGGGMLFKRELLDKIGFLDVVFSTAYFEDVDYCFRAWNWGFKIGWNYKSRIIHESHKTLGKLENSVKHKILEENWNRFREKWGIEDLPLITQEEIV
jgi:GT2 family glycosyltransferase